MALLALKAVFLLPQSGYRQRPTAGYIVKARTVVGIIVGFFSWWVVFFVSLVLMALLWPDFGNVGKSVQVSGDYSALTTGMLVLLLCGYVYISGISGWVTVKISGRKAAIWIACAPTAVYAVYEHLHVLWHVLPAWYNLGVVGFIYPFSFLGGSLASTRQGMLARPATPG
jgi:hypothetical protein